MKNKNFTLLELLVVIAIIAILAAMLMPALSAARGQARIASCKNNQRQTSLGLFVYANDFDEWGPEMSSASLHAYKDFAARGYLSKGDKAPSLLCPDSDERWRNSASYTPGKDIGGYIVSSYMFAFGHNENWRHFSYTFYGFHYYSGDTTFCPRLNLLGNNSAVDPVNGVKRKILAGSKQPMMGDLGSADIGVIYPSGMGGTDVRMSHFNFGCNIMYMDGHADFTPKACYLNSGYLKVAYASGTYSLYFLK